MKLINKEDIKALARIENVLNHLDTILDEVSKNKIFDKKIENDKKFRFVADDRNYFRDYIKYEDFSLNYGFGWFLPKEVFVYLDFCIYKEDKSEVEARTLADDIKNKFNGIEEFYDNKDAISVGFKEPLDRFLKKENQKETIVEKLNGWIRNVKDFKDKNLELFKV